VRELRPHEVDPEMTGLINISPEYLEVLQAWDPRELPKHLADIGSDEATAYVDRHFMLLGVPVECIALATRRLSLSDLDAAELNPPEAQAKPQRKTATAGSRAGRSPSGRRTNAVERSNSVPLHGDRQ